MEADNRGRLLLVDDDPEYCGIVSGILRRIGHSVNVVHDGTSGVKAAVEERPDLVLLDYAMPGEDGLTVCTHLRRLDEGLPVVLLTGHPSPELVKAAVEAGAIDFLDKSSPSELLKLRIETALRCKQTNLQSRRRIDELSFVASVVSSCNAQPSAASVVVEIAKAMERFKPVAFFVLRTSGEGEVLASVAPSESLKAQVAFAAGLPRLTQLKHRIHPWALSTSGSIMGCWVKYPTDIFFGLVVREAPSPENQSLYEDVLTRAAVALERVRQLEDQKRISIQLSSALETLARSQADRVSNERLLGISQIAAGVAHEINNPLAFVISNLSVLRDYVHELKGLLANYLGERPRGSGGRLSHHMVLDDLEPLIQETLDGGFRMQAIVRKLRGFAQQGQTEVVEPVDLEIVVESVLSLLQGELAARLDVERVFFPAPRVRGSRAKLSQVMVNLVTRAAELSPENRRGHLKVTVRGEQGAAILRVEDDGPLLEESQRARIFEPFGAVENISAGGLDLAMCKQIVERHGGSIGVEPSPLGGMAFIVRLKGVTAPATQPPSPSETALPEEPEGDTLFIDDEPYLLSTYQRALNRITRVHLADGGDVALAILDAGARFDLILCDLVMPRVSGAEVYEWILSHRPELAERFVIITGGQQDQRNQAFLERTGLPVVVKPFRLPDLMTLVRQYTRSH